MTGTQFSHANIRVRDAVASVEFYERLGLSLRGCLRLGDGAYAVYMATAEAPNVTVELVVNENADASYDRSAGSGHIALAVNDLDSLVGRLTEAGVELESAPFLVAGRDEIRVCFLRDPDGTRVELIAGTFPTPQDPLPDALANRS